MEGLFSPFTKLMLDHISWRNASITRAYVSGETISLQWYLNKLFDPFKQRVRIETATVTGVLAGISTDPNEEDYFFVAGMAASEPNRYTIIPIPGEDSIFGNASFGVFVPASFTSRQTTALSGTVKTYKMAGKSFVIIPR